MSAPAVSVVVPTRNRGDYLDVTLASLSSQRAGAAYEIVVVDDNSTDATRVVAEGHGVPVKPVGPPGGLNASRNTGVAETTGALVAFVDDDIWAPPGWLAALLDGAARHPEAEAFGGPIRARFEGPAPRACGREAPPITTLDLGGVDRPAEMVWGANFAVRRSAIERLGPFDPAVAGHGDEEDWLIALTATGGQIVYLAGAGVDHRRVGDDARLRSLSLAAFRRGRAAKRSERRRGRAPGGATDLRNLAGAGWHTVRRRCPQGLIMGAHSAGRLAETLRRP